MTGPEAPRPDRPHWRDEVAVLARRAPRVARVVRHLRRSPLAVLLPVAVVTSARLVDATRPADTVGFLRAGRTLLTPDGWDVFADPWLQVGPVLLLAMGLWAAVADVVGTSPYLVVGAVHGGIVLWLGDAVTRRWVPPGRDPTSARWAVGLTLVAGGVMERSFLPGHEEDLVIALLLAAAAAGAASRRPVRVGLLLALGFGLKAWAVLGGGLVLHGRRWSRALVGAGVAAGVVVAMYLPFLVRGDVNTLDYSWGIAHGASLFGELGRLAGLSDWGLRAVQAGVAGIAGAATALRRHGSALAVVVVAVGVRLLLEPHQLWYYPSPFLLLTVLWVWTSPAVRRTGVRVATVLAVPLFLQHYFFVPVGVLQVTEALTYLGTVVAVLVLEHRGRRPDDAGGPGADATGTRDRTAATRRDGAPRISTR